MKLSRSLVFLASTLYASTSLAVSLVDLTQQDTLKHKSSEYQVTQINTITDGAGNTHIRYEQTYQGIPVYGYQILEHHYQPSLVAPGLTLKPYTGTLIQEIEKDLPAQSFLAGSSPESTLVRLKNAYANRQGLGLDQLVFENEKARTVIFVNEHNKAQLAHEVSFYVDNLEEGQPSRPYALVDADSGKIIKQWEGLTYQEVGTGPGGNGRIGFYRYGEDYPALDVKLKDKKCHMKNEAGKTVDLNNRKRRNGADHPFSYFCTKSTEQDTDSVNGAGSPLNDAHFFVQILNEFYMNRYQSAPLSTPLVMRAHYGKNFANAFWNGSSMTYGDGNETLYPFVILDIAAHEIAHGVTEKNSGLIYEGQSGGMNEAFSDIASRAVESYVNGTHDWNLGGGIFKDLNVQGLRFMDNPPADGRSIDNASQYSPELDVHYTSGVYNKAFYLLATTEGWDTLGAFDVMYYANTAYWEPNTTFASGAVGVMQSAAALGQNVDDVVNAFSQVGIACDKVTQTCI